jgi:hypothetical protein
MQRTLENRLPTGLTRASARGGAPWPRQASSPFDFRRQPSCKGWRRLFKRSLVAGRRGLQVCFHQAVKLTIEHSLALPVSNSVR